MDCCSSPSVQAELKQIENDAQKTFHLWTKDAIQALKHQDIEFLKSMKINRIASSGVYALASQIQRKGS